MSQKKLNSFVILIAAIAATAGLLFGFDTGNIAGALLYIKNDLQTSTLQNELIVSITVLGAFFGAFSSGKLVNHYGRRNLLIAASLLFILGALLGAYSQNITELVFARLLLGLAIGVSSYTAPLYISEIAPANYRGALVLLNGVAITSGEAIAYLLDYYFTPSANWRMMIFMGIIPGIILFIGMLFMPYSPRWLLLKSKHTLAIDVLKKIRGTIAIDAELAEIKEAISSPKIKFKEFFTRKLRLPIVVGVGLGVLQQFVGINTVMYYGPVIFKHAGFASGTSQILATLGMGIMNVIMTIITGLIVDRFGRRLLLIIGSFIAGISLLFVSFLFHSGMQNNNSSIILVICMTTYIIGYCMSVGSLFWLIIAEIFPLNVRSAAMSFATAIQWAANFIVSVSFLSMLDKLGADLTFGCYAIMCFVTVLFTYYLIPETKGLSLEQIENIIKLPFRLAIAWRANKKQA